MEGQAREGEQDLDHNMNRGSMADSETLGDLGRGAVAESEALEDLGHGAEADSETLDDLGRGSEADCGTVEQDRSRGAWSHGGADRAGSQG